MNIIDQIEKEQLRKDITPFNIGDTVRVNVKVKEGDKERIQAYEGVVIAKKGSGVRETFTVRRVSFGIGVERTFPLHSPRIDKIVVTRKAKVRRAKIYYIRDLSGKAAKVKEDIKQSSFFVLNFLFVIGNCSQFMFKKKEKLWTLKSHVKTKDLK